MLNTRDFLYSYNNNTFLILTRERKGAKRGRRGPGGKGPRRGNRKIKLFTSLRLGVSSLELGTRC